jgi:hypothetical protein
MKLKTQKKLKNLQKKPKNTKKNNNFNGSQLGVWVLLPCVEPRIGFTLGGE